MDDKSSIIECSICDYKANTKMSIMHHIANNHLGKMYICKYCPYASNNKFSLDNHMQIHDHRNDRFMCLVQDCDFITRHKKGLMLHYESLHKGVKYLCQSCGYQATQKTHLRSHIKSVL